MIGAIKGDVAVKVMPPTIKGDLKLAAQVFQRENESLSRLKHPNIVELLEVGKDKDTGERYFVFPWLETGLSKAIEEIPLLGWDDFWGRFGRELLDGLAYAHSESFAHRDIKPQNILIGEDDRPRLGDFGIAKSIARIAPDLTLREHATRPYAPKGYDDGRHPTQRDVYSFAVLAVLGITKVDPFKGYEEDPYRAIEDALACLDVPSGIDELLRRCLHDDPVSRPSDAVKLRELIEVVEEERASLAPKSAAKRPDCHLYLSPKVLTTLLDALDLQTELQVEEFVADDLAEETAVLNYDRETFEDGTATTDHYHLIGTELRIHIRVAEETRDHLVAVNAWAVPTSAMDRERDRGWVPDWNWKLSRPQGDSTSVTLIETLEREVSTRVAEEELRRKRAARERQLVVWRRTLAALRALESTKESPISYISASETPTGIHFIVANPPPEELLGQIRVVQGTEGQFLYGEVTDLDRDVVTLMPSRGSFSSLPDQGELRVDTMASRSALRRQEQGLDALQYDRSLRPELRELLLNPSTVRIPKPADEIRWNQQLDAAKRDAVSTALGAEDLVLVEGPPGTGKTTFITELVLQHLARHPDDRVLISSQTNAALDNALERLVEADPELRLIRIARRGDPRIAPGVRSLLLEEQIDRWRAEVIASGRSWLGKWAENRGLGVDQLETAMRLEELAKERRVLERLDFERRDLNARLDQKSGTPPDDAAAALEERLKEIAEESAAARASAEQANERLIELGSAKRSDQLTSQRADMLSAHAREAMPTTDEGADECRTLIDLISDWHARFGRGSAFPAATLMRSQVVAATCVGYASVPGSESIEFDLCVIDEASKAMATEMLVPMTRARRWVVVGDHRQLPPFVDDALRNPSLLKRHKIRLDEIEATLFDRLRSQLPAACSRTLTRQHRMIPAIGNLISECFYRGSLSSEPREPASWLSALAPAPVTWLTTARREDRHETRHGTTVLNHCEAECVASILASAELAGKRANRRLSVVVLTGYSGQRDLIRREIEPRLRDWKHLDVLCSTVDAYQGREADIAIYSVTRSNAKGELGFLKEERRLNVALSRGREALILIGDHAGLRQSAVSNPFLPVLDYIETDEDCALEEIKA